jgi:hypothetical protein
MRKIARFRIALLALMLVASHVALISHVTAHFAPNLEQCELCVSQAQLFSAIPSSDQGFPVDPGYNVLQISALQYAVPARFSTAYHPRAPPLLSV